MSDSQNILQKFAIKVSDWSEKWFPDSYIFALLGVVIVAIASIAIGAPANRLHYHLVMVFEFDPIYHANVAFFHRGRLRRLSV